ncbi:hypothetical protein LCGC14_1141800 [marine sediment metagenome]|uniref:Response regulatory domain-containing protein n=1 Tax=marine sediment metagenome TaxID=412755 RepID=A0A0F9PG76_9ZZZZ
MRNLKLVLELNDYEVMTSMNGKKALILLSTIKRVPEIIISDILMPELDGYDLFKAVSNNPILNHVPFVFLSGRNTPEDVRFGKMLGVDDYLTKPFKEEDLLAIITGKISRKKKTKGINEKVEVLLTSLNVNIVPSISEKEKSSVVLLLVFWDDRAGPTLISSFPDDENTSFSSDKVGQQLFNSMLSLYGQDKITKPEGVLLNIENIQKHGYIFFDSYPDMDMRGETKRYMLGLIAPEINYFDSLKIKETFIEISSKIKQKEDWDIKQYWEDLSTGLWTHFSIK